MNQWFSVYQVDGSISVTSQTIDVQSAQITDLIIRIRAEALTTPEYDVVPVCRTALPTTIQPPTEGLTYRGYSESVLSVALQAFPSPDDSCSWQDILDFKAEMHDKQWAFRRFLNDLATKPQKEAELRDDIEWMLNQYGKEMNRFKLKRSVSFMETYVIPTVEAFESFKPSAFLKGLVSIKKRKIELLEAEIKAPGRECAYVFDARKRFGGASRHSQLSA